MHLRPLYPLIQRQLFSLLLLVVASAAQAQICNKGVQPSTSSDNFVIHSDGTVTDISTGLMWTSCVIGQRWDDETCQELNAVSTFRSWGRAVSDASRSKLAGYDDWRLPTLEELSSIIEHSCTLPSINSSIFPNSFTGLHWTLDSYSGNHEYAWAINFADGTESTELKPITSYVARLVRGEMPKPEERVVVVPALKIEMDSDELRLERSKLNLLNLDGIHDVFNPNLNMLQNPLESMKEFDRNQWGRINWVEALRSGDIQPKTGVYTNEPMLELDMDILFKDTGDMAYVTFPHSTHTQWLACSNCHTKLFPYKSGVIDIKMDDVLKGEYCGLCHGKVAFSPMLCERCHNTPKQ